MLLKKAGLYFHTLRHLKPIQIYARIHKKLITPRFIPVADIALRKPVAAWQQVIRKPSSVIAPATFRFLNEEHNLDETGWDDPSLAKLWRYNLHYFDDLNAQDHDWHSQWIARWLAESPPTRGTAWEPYPTSLRIVNWVKWLLAGNEPPDGMTQSLADQSVWLARNLEYHILGNHLFANAKALVIAGSYFDGPEAEEWLAKGLGILSKELDEQILPDGGHFELSPMYHAVILEDMLDILQIGRCYGMLPPELAQRMKVKAKDMLFWLEVMSHPDGQISFFNDAAFGIAANYAQLFDYAQVLDIEKPAPGKALEHLRDSGYIRAQSGPWTAILDVARIGPDYLPGHAHADCLSFELSCGTQRIIINSGTSVYGLSTERLRQRSTAAHNTLEINGQNSAEVWSGFRVARRGAPFDLDIKKSGAEGFEISCAHSGYKYLRGGPVHNRQWRIAPEQIDIIDTIQGSYESGVVHYHFHPDVIVSLDAQGKSGTIQGKTQVIGFKIMGGCAELRSFPYHPEFGQSISGKKLAIRLNSDPLVFRLRTH